LLIDTTQKEQTSVALVGRGKDEFLTKPVRAQALMDLTDELLRLGKNKWEDISAVAALTGPGSYTGTRMGVTVANTIGWLKNLPVYGLPEVSFDEGRKIIRSGQLPRPSRQIKACQ